METRITQIHRYIQSIFYSLGTSVILLPNISFVPTENIIKTINTYYAMGFFFTFETLLKNIFFKIWIIAIHSLARFYVFID